MSPQQIMLLRRHASSAAALLERKETDKPSSNLPAPTIRGAGQHSVKKRPPPARPPLPVRLRSISHQPLPGQLSEFQGELMKNVKTDRRSRGSKDEDPHHQIYVSSTSRICLADSLDGLVEKVAPKLVGCRAKAPLPPTVGSHTSSRTNNNIQTMRNVTVEGTIEMQSVACWLEGSFVFHFSVELREHPCSSLFFFYQFCGSFDRLSPLPGGLFSLSLLHLYKRIKVRLYRANKLQGESELICYSTWAFILFSAIILSFLFLK